MGNGGSDVLDFIGDVIGGIGGGGITGDLTSIFDIICID